MVQVAEATHYYYGLPSCPVLVARSSTIPWEAHTGPEVFWKCKELRTVFHHPLHKLWEDKLAPKVHDLLDSMKVNWTSIDIVRIGYHDEYYAPVVLWIGVTPGSLSGNDGGVVVSKCIELLKEYDITDVEVEIRESVVVRY